MLSVTKHVALPLAVAALCGGSVAMAQVVKAPQLAPAPNDEQRAVSYLQAQRDQLEVLALRLQTQNQDIAKQLADAQKALADLRTHPPACPPPNHELPHSERPTPHPAR